MDNNVVSVVVQVKHRLVLQMHTRQLQGVKLKPTSHKMWECLQYNNNYMIS